MIRDQRSGAKQLAAFATLRLARLLHIAGRMQISNASRRLALLAGVLLASIVSSSVAHAGPGWGKEECTIKEMKTWKVPSDDCIAKFREMVFKPGTSFECEGWTAWWATKQGMPGRSSELAEGKGALPAVFIGRVGCNENSETVCVMAVRKLASFGGIDAPQPFPTICTEISKDRQPVLKQACVRGNLDWQRQKLPRPKVLDDISPPSPPERTDNPKGVATATDKINCTTCHTVPYVASTRHLVLTLATSETGTPGEMMNVGGEGFKNPDDAGNWLNTTDAGTRLIRAIIKHNRTSARDPTKLVWKEVNAIPWFGKNTGVYKVEGTPLRRTCGAGKGCHNYGFAINNHANWTQDGDQRDVPDMGGKQFMDKNYCEFVAAPAFAKYDKPITYDNDLFSGGMHWLQDNFDVHKWANEDQCKSWWKSVGCTLDADKQKSVVNLCKKADYPEMFTK